MPVNPSITRRMLLRSSGGLVAALLGPRLFCGAAQADAAPGVVIGEPTAEKVGRQVLADGGNAVDAIVAAALTAAVAAPHQTGIGGYGTHIVLAVDQGRRIVVIDGNTAAPAAMKADTFQSDAAGQVPGRINEFGWRAAGVPGILAGLQLALDWFGTRSFRELVQPAILIARDGFPWPAALANTIRTSAAQFAQDPGSRSWGPCCAAVACRDRGRSDGPDADRTATSRAPGSGRVLRL